MFAIKYSSGGCGAFWRTGLLEASFWLRSPLVSFRSDFFAVQRFSACCSAVDLVLTPELLDKADWQQACTVVVMVIKVIDRTLQKCSVAVQDMKREYLSREHLHSYVQVCSAQKNNEMSWCTSTRAEIYGQH